ncbi:hypothetical protein MJO28_005731 [Puccinia striiformis f. sp. tritici]|uniref:Uncharacterized protein n=1 Tax=Puccinia striiformis f. sp. tritici TaxID=168172 RepID=A0ACC0EPJ2_9BASI|nr:hypothetical protein MJO28_005731 [Puccinia striiformis f. sp. tritici]
MLNWQHMKERERTNQYGLSFELAILDLNIFTTYIINKKLSLEIYLIGYLTKIMQMPRLDLKVYVVHDAYNPEYVSILEVIYQHLTQSHSLFLFDMNYAGSVCICRVPKANLKPGTVVECVHCSCRGCASGD